MSNMAYCRFNNTLSDLRDCYEHMDEVLSYAEMQAMIDLVRLCRRIADEYGDFAAR